MADEIMYSLMELSGQEYVDMYAAKAKEDQARAAQNGQVSARMPAARAS
jgi:1-acyl-sn-glycerol-3-phosphate acyltransferase